MQVASSVGSLQVEHIPPSHSPLTPFIMQAEPFEPVQVSPGMPPVPIPAVPPVLMDVVLLDEVVVPPVLMDVVVVPPVPGIEVVEVDDEAPLPLFEEPLPQPTALASGDAASTVMIRRCRQEICMSPPFEKNVLVSPSSQRPEHRACHAHPRANPGAKRSLMFSRLTVASTESTALLTPSIVRRGAILLGYAALQPSMITRAPIREPLDTNVEIETPEHVRFRYHVAGPAKRAVAYLIDLLIRGVIVLVLGIVAVLAGVGSSDGMRHASSGLQLLVLFVVEWAYYVVFETVWSGRTPGKRALSLRVVTDGGHPLRFADSVLRNLLRAADFLPGAYAVGLAVMGRDPRFRRLGDLAAGTIVIAEERADVGGPLVLDPPPSPAELRPLPQRLPLSGEELDAIELFLRRARKLSTARELELADIVAPIFARRMGLRYKDAPRFLALLHHRAHEHRSAGPQVGRSESARRRKAS